MSLEISYEVLEMLRDDGVQTFRAKEKTTGRGLELHLFLPFGRPENKTLFEKLKALPLEQRRNFLDIGVDGSTPYVVTDPLPGSRGFKGWAEELIAGTQPQSSGFSTGILNAMPSRDDGVQILQAGQWRTGTPIPDSLITRPAMAPAPPPPPPAHAAQATQAETGDFTRMFQAPAFLASPQSPPSPQAAAPPPSEFTSFFKSPEPAGAEAPGEAKPPVGEFTGLFSPDKPTPAPPPPVSNRQSFPPPPPTAVAMPAAVAEPGPGEFTRMFQAPPAAASFPNQQAPQQATPPQRTVQPEAGGAEFTKYFENPLKPAPMGSPQPMIELPPPPPPSGAKRAGDFTEVFGRPSGPAPSGSPGGFSFDSPAPQAPPPQGPVFGATGSATGAFSGQPAWPQQPQAQPSFPSGPSEYTKMMSAPQMAQGPAPSVFNSAPNYAPPAQVAVKKSNAPLFIAIGVVLLLVIGIVLFLVLRQPATIPAAK